MLRRVQYIDRPSFPDELFADVDSAQLRMALRNLQSAVRAVTGAMRDMYAFPDGSDLKVGVTPETHLNARARQSRVGGPFSIELSEQDHGPSGTSLGLLVNDVFAYSTDVAIFTDSELDRLRNIPVWIVDCLRVEPARSHANLETALGWINRVKPGRAYFTHMAASLDYEETLAKCPPGTEPGYDGLVIEI